MLHEECQTKHVSVTSLFFLRVTARILCLFYLASKKREEIFIKICDMRITFNPKKVQKYLNPQIEMSDTEFILRIPQHTPLSWIKNK
jgi:hypothetical protein